MSARARENFKVRKRDEPMEDLMKSKLHHNFYPSKYTRCVSIQELAIKKIRSKERRFPGAKTSFIQSRNNVGQ